MIVWRNAIFSAAAIAAVVNPHVRAEAGSGKYWVDQVNEQCLLDSSECDLPICKEADSWTQLYDTIKECCAFKLSWIDPKFCETRSQQQFTNKWYADYLNEQCFKDCNDEDPLCKVLEDSSEDLYDSEEDCCSFKLSWVNPEVCIAKSTNDWTDKFYVSQDASSPNRCEKHCAEYSGAVCGGDPKDTTTKLFNTAEECCTAKVWWVNEDKCVQDTTGISSKGTLQYYVDWDLEKCVLGK